MSATVVNAIRKAINRVSTVLLMRRGSKPGMKGSRRYSTGVSGTGITSDNASESE